MTSFDFLEPPAWSGEFRMVECRRALGPSRLPGIDWALNPYGGCEHLCAYCFAPELTHTPWEEWGVVRVRKGIASRLERELIGLKGVIGVGTVTDPWQPAERRFLNTRSCLQRLQSRSVGVHCHTKSDLVLRDVELLASAQAEVGVSITSLDDESSLLIEPGASLPSQRLDALRGLKGAGVECYALLGPLLSVLEGREEELLQSIDAAGVRRIMLDPLHPRPLLSQRLASLGVRGSSQALQRLRSLADEMSMEAMDAF